MTTKYAIKGQPFIQYDGTNGADIVSAFNVDLMSVTLVSEIDGVLTVDWSYDGGPPYYGEGEIVGSTGDWFTSANLAIAVVSDAEFSTEWIATA